MDQLLVEIKIDDYWNIQLHPLLIFQLNLTNPAFYYVKCRIHTEMFPWCRVDPVQMPSSAESALCLKLFPKPGLQVTFNEKVGEKYELLRQKK